ncbi:SU10 major capsid protein [Glutamicibacter sp. AOP5-A2-18]|uniref:SU10 major capsid protein n=1 Tax=Glutamicibacter sp. AOP5-A2-18 TaxID=3457656 RepID=UPI00403342AA
MAGITGLGTTYNLPNYVGELFAASPEDTPLLSSIGGLTGGESVGSTLFEWQGYDLRDADDARQRLEGADAGAGDARVRYNASNVLEIHQEAVAVSYTKQGATKQRATNAMPNVTVGNTVIPADELAWQLEQQFKQIARDIEKTFITGTYASPTTNTAPRKTRGLLQAVATNVGVAEYALAGAPADVLKDALDDLMQDVWTSGGIQEGETRTLITNASLKRALSAAYITNAGYKEETRNVGGVNVQTIETDFGRFNIMLNRYMPADKIAIASLEDLRPSFLEIPGKGHFFAEPLAKTGASDKVQIYGEIGLNYGNEKKHGVLTLTQAEE